MSGEKRKMKKNKKIFYLGLILGASIILSSCAMDGLDENAVINKSSSEIVKNMETSEVEEELIRTSLFDTNKGIDVFDMNSKMYVKSLLYSHVDIDGVFYDKENQHLICSIDCWDDSKLDKSCLLVYVYSLQDGRCLHQIEYETGAPIFFTDAYMLGSSLYENARAHASIPIEIDTLTGEIRSLDAEYTVAKEMEKDYGNLMCFYPIKQDGNEMLFFAGYGDVSVNDDIVYEKILVFKDGVFIRCK